MPIDTVALAKLSEWVSAFSFMGTVNHKTVFQNNQVEITERAARQLGELIECAIPTIPALKRFLCLRFYLNGLSAIFA